MTSITYNTAPDKYFLTREKYGSFRQDITHMAHESHGGRMIGAPAGMYGPTWMGQDARFKVHEGTWYTGAVFYLQAVGRGGDATRKIIDQMDAVRRIMDPMIRAGMADPEKTLNQIDGFEFYYYIDEFGNTATPEQCAPNEFRQYPEPAKVWERMAADSKAEAEARIERMRQEYAVDTPSEPVHLTEPEQPAAEPAEPVRLTFSERLAKGLANIFGTDVKAAQ